MAEIGNWRAEGLVDPVGAIVDVRAYFEEAALALVDHVPAARQSDAWLFTRTQAGQLARAVQRAVREGGADHAGRFYLADAQGSPTGVGSNRQRSARRQRSTARRHLVGSPLGALQ